MLHHNKIIPPFLTNVTLRSVFRLGEIDEGHVRRADEEGDDPDDEDHQQRVPCGQPGGQGVDDAHVPQMTIFREILGSLFNRGPQVHSSPVASDHRFKLDYVDYYSDQFHHVAFLVILS